MFSASPLPRGQFRGDKFASGPRLRFGPPPSRGLMCNAGGGAFVDEGACLEAVESELTDERVRTIVGNRVCHGVAARGNGFVTAGAPAAVDVEAVDVREAHDRTCVGCDVDHSGPLAHLLEPTEAGYEFEHCAYRGLHR